MTPLFVYKPSTFYFRQSLRAVEDVLALLKIVRSLHAEIQLCRDFARLHGVMDRHDSDGTLFETPDALEELRTKGMLLCCELENVKQAIRDQGLVPPKRHIMRQEAEDKGWPLDAA